MKHSILTHVIAGFALTAAIASVNCSGDDSTGPAGGGGGTAGTGGSAGTGGTAGVDASTDGSTGGSGGTAGAGGAAGAGGVRDAAPDVDARADVRSDVFEASIVAFGDVTAIFDAHCIGCHNGVGPAAGRIDLSTSDAGNGTLYLRLTSPLPAAPAGFEGLCGGFGATDGGDEAGLDGGDAGEGGVSDAAAATRIPIVANSLANSFLYTKITGTQVPGNPPGGCGQRMPRVGGSTDGGIDGGAVASVGCDIFDGGAAANCLTEAQANTIRDWILSGAPQN